MCVPEMNVGRSEALWESISSTLVSKRRILTGDASKYVISFINTCIISANCILNLRVRQEGETEEAFSGVCKGENRFGKIWHVLISLGCNLHLHLSFNSANSVSAKTYSSWGIILLFHCLFMQKIGDSYRGYCSSETELESVLTLHKQQTQSVWGTRQSPSPAKPATRLMWKSQYVPYDGIPFVNAGINY